jgi:NADH dehydrogenase
MATIGKSAAVANIKWPFQAHWSGFPAWLAWLMVHIFFLVGFRNRFSVFREWMWTYLRGQDSARLITGSQILPGWDRKDLREGVGEDGDLTTVPLTADQSEARMAARG